MIRFGLRLTLAGGREAAIRLAVMAGTAPKPPRIRQPARVLWGRHDPAAAEIDRFFRRIGYRPAA